MSDEARSRRPMWFTVLAWVLVLWNVMGVLSFVMHLATPAEQLRGLSEAQRLIIEGYAGWATLAFAVFVFCGSLGSLLLALGRELAVPLLVASLVGLIVQKFHDFVVAGAVAAFGPLAVIYSVPSFAISVVLVLLALKAWSEHWLGEYMGSHDDEIRRLAERRQQGAMSDDEFDAQHRELLAGQRLQRRYDNQRRRRNLLRAVFLLAGWLLVVAVLSRETLGQPEAWARASTAHIEGYTERENAREVFAVMLSMVYVVGGMSMLAMPLIGIPLGQSQRRLRQLEEESLEGGLVLKDGSKRPSSLLPAWLVVAILGSVFVLGFAVFVPSSFFQELGLPRLPKAVDWRASLALPALAWIVGCVLLLMRRKIGALVLILSFVIVIVIPLGTGRGLNFFCSLPPYLITLLLLGPVFHSDFEWSTRR